MHTSWKIISIKNAIWQKAKGKRQKAKGSLVAGGIYKSVFGPQTRFSVVPLPNVGSQTQTLGSPQMISAPPPWHHELRSVSCWAPAYVTQRRDQRKLFHRISVLWHPQNEVCYAPTEVPLCSKNHQLDPLKLTISTNNYFSSLSTIAIFAGSSFSWSTDHRHNSNVKYSNIKAILDFMQYLTTWAGNKMW